jgi:hypothetical protein
MIDVVPPASPAAVPLKKSSLATVPMKGNCIWVCGSMPPGIRYWPLPSSTRHRREYRGFADGADHAVGAQHRRGNFHHG